MMSARLAGRFHAQRKGRNDDKGWQYGSIVQDSLATSYVILKAERRTKATIHVDTDYRGSQRLGMYRLTIRYSVSAEYLTTRN